MKSGAGRAPKRSHLLRQGMKGEECGQLLLVTCVILAISILTIAEITSTSIYFEQDDPYDDGNTDVVLAETQSSFLYTLNERFKNASAGADVEARIYALFNSTRDLFYTIAAEHGEHLHIKLQSVQESSPDTYKIEVSFSLTEKNEKVSVTSEFWLVK